MDRKSYKKIITSFCPSVIKDLRSGEAVLFSGHLYTARDQAHKRIVQLIKAGKKLPFDLNDSIIYYCGPTKARPTNVIGSCGPTTSRRMDVFTPLLLDKGLKGMIGKGRRSKEVIDAIRKNRAVYFTTYAGCGALIARYVRSSKIVAFSDLGPEAVARLTVEDLPLIVAVDSRGGDIYHDKITV